MGLIDADKVLDIVAAYCPDDDGSCSKAGIDLREMLDEIEALPEIDAEPVKHGKWIETNDETKKRCSECDVIHLIAQYPHGNANYCPNCGAKMNGGEKNE